MSREIHVRFCESLGVRFPRATRLQVFKSTSRTAYRVRDRLVKFLEKRMHLQVNREKSGVVPFEEATFLGFRYARPVEPSGDQRRVSVRVVLSEKAKSRFKARVRQLTRRTAGRSLEDITADLNRFMRGWVGYYRFAQDYFFGDVMPWIRRRLRAVKLKQWGCRNAVRKALIRAGVHPVRAAKTALSTFGWRAAHSPQAHTALPNQWFEQLGLVDLARYSFGPGAN